MFFFLIVTQVSVPKMEHIESKNDGMANVATPARKKAS